MRVVRNKRPLLLDAIAALGDILFLFDETSPILRAAMKPKALATLTVHQGDNLTKAQARRLANWLRRTAKFVEAEHKQLSRRFTARLMPFLRVASRTA